MDWVKKIEELSRKTAKEPKGKGWFTAAEFRKEAKVGYSRAYQLLKKAREEGEVEVYAGNCYSSEMGQLVRKVWYRFVSSK